MPRRSEAEHLTELGDFVTAQKAKHNKLMELLPFSAVMGSRCFVLCLLPPELERVSYLPPDPSVFAKRIERSYDVPQAEALGTNRDA